MGLEGNSNVKEKKKCNYQCSKKDKNLSSYNVFGLYQHPK